MVNSGSTHGDSTPRSSISGLSDTASSSGGIVSAVEVIEYNKAENECVVDLPPFEERRRASGRASVTHPFLTRVESLIDPGRSVVPPPVTIASPEPACGVYTGAGYGQSTISRKSVDMLEEKIVYKTVKQIVHRPVEVIRTVPKIVTKQVAQFRKVIDENDVVEIPKPYKVETRHFVPNFIDTPRYAFVSERSVPNVVHDDEPTDVHCVIAQPEMRVVDIYVPKVVNGSIVCKKGLTRVRRLDQISQAEWNSLVLKLNPKLCEIGDLSLLPVHPNETGQVIAYTPEAKILCQGTAYKA